MKEEVEAPIAGGRYCDKAEGLDKQERAGVVAVHVVAQELVWIAGQEASYELPATSDDDFPVGVHTGAAHHPGVTGCLGNCVAQQAHRNAILKDRNGISGPLHGPLEESDGVDARKP